MSQLTDQSVRFETAFASIKIIFFFSIKRRHTRLQGDWSSDVCSSDLQIDPQAVFERIDPEKDVDGLSPANAGRLALGRPRLIPATPLGILVLIEHAGASVEG